VPQPSEPSRPATIVARHVTVHRGIAPVLVQVDVTVGPGHRIGVIGPNGVGKTTLLRVLAGDQLPDAGAVRTMPPAASVGYLSQEPDVRGNETLSEQLLRRTGVGEAERQLAEAAERLAGGDAAATERYSAALERYLSLGAADFEARLRGVLDEVGLHQRLLDVRVSQLSGGQRARASLASVLLSRFDILLLDEPTNDLDFDGLERLESFVGTRKGGLVVVSHDRAFLDRVVNVVLEIDEATHRATRYAGGFAAYLDARTTARRHAEEAYRTYAGERDRLRAREREQRQWALRGVGKERSGSRDNDKAQRDFRLNRTEKQASKVRITEKALERLEVVEKPYEGWVLDLELHPAHRSGDIVARLEGAIVRRGGWRLGPVDLDIRFAERVAILGANGAGKSTLIGAIVGTIALDEGRRSLGPSVLVGELRQGRGRFSVDGSTLIEQFRATTGLPVPEARSLLAKFGLGADHVGRTAASLSPGERTRADLAVLMAQGANLLVLDEPTNHLDLPAIEQLEDALIAWGGTLVLVTHDRRLLETVPLTRRLTLEGGLVVGDVAP
jgi:ATPase subunit of ABC transporter with duplicated ATPase domains